MPLHIYSCGACAHEFETLVRGEATPCCPECSSEALERLVAATAIKTSTTHGLSMRAARKRDAMGAAQGTRAQLEYERSHDDD